jgi:hypothetical protein
VVIKQPDLDLFGTFPGHDLPDDECEVILYTLWPDKERKREAKLFAQKWWDYRTLSVVHATYLFSHILTTETRSIIRAHIDDAPATVAPNGTVRDWNPIKAGDVFDPPSQASRMPYWRRKVGGLIRARQAADAEGIPYEVFVKAGLRHFYFGAGSYVLQRQDQNGSRTVMPEPNLLYGEDCLAQIRDTWLQALGSRLHAAEHPRYRIANDDGHADHAEHRDWLRQQLDRRPVQDWAAARLVRDGLLSRDQALGMVRDPEALRQRLA